MVRFITSFVIVFIAWLVFALFKRDKSSISFLDKSHSSILRGYAICAIVCSHLGQYIGINGVEFLGAIGVSLFIFLSGYGLSESNKINGRKHFWRKKLLRIFIPYILILVIWYLISGFNYSLLEIVLDFCLIKPLHPFGWYLRFLVVCYIIFYFSTFIRNTNVKIIFISISFLIWFIVRSVFLIYSTPFLQARQLLAFPLGMATSANIVRIRSMISRNRGGRLFILALGLILFGLGVYAFNHFSIFNIESVPLVLYNFSDMFTCVLCAMGIVVLVYKFSFLQNKLMSIIAPFSMEIYLIHGYLLNYSIFLDSIWGILLFFIVLLTLVFVFHIIITLLSMLLHKFRFEGRNA